MAEKETPIHVGYICCCARLQYLFLDCKLLNKSYWHLLLLSLLWQKHYICNMNGSGPADVFPEEGADELPEGQAELLPLRHQKCGHQDQQM